jgi:hypothetical protein
MKENRRESENKTPQKPVFYLNLRGHNDSIQIDRSKSPINKHAV